MTDKIKILKEYFLETLGLKVEPKAFEYQNKFSIFLKNSYIFYFFVIFDKPYILAIAKYPEESTPAQIAKHIEEIEKITKERCIYVAEALPAYNRQRLIAHKVPFVILTTQMYLPDLGIDFRKASKHNPSRVSHRITSSAQTVVIYALINKDKKEFTPSELATKLGYTRMSMTRALNELETANLGKTIRRGKERYFCFHTRKKDLWKQTMGILQTPIKEVFWIQETEQVCKKIKTFGFIAGLSALSLQSNLNPPSYPIYAIFKDKWKDLIKSENIKKIPISEECSMQVEIWHYDPDLFDKDRIVDPFSLYLSLKALQDERIEKALIDMMEKIKW